MPRAAAVADGAVPAEADRGAAGHAATLAAADVRSPGVEAGFAEANHSAAAGHTPAAEE